MKKKCLERRMEKQEFILHFCARLAIQTAPRLPRAIIEDVLCRDAISESESAGM